MFLLYPWKDSHTLCCGRKNMSLRSLPLFEVRHHLQQMLCFITPLAPQPRRKYAVHHAPSPHVTPHIAIYWYCCAPFAPCSTRHPTSEQTLQGLTIQCLPTAADCRRNPRPLWLFACHFSPHVPPHRVNATYNRQESLRHCVQHPPNSVEGPHTTVADASQ